jgi:hypothetical protein
MSPNFDWSFDVIASEDIIDLCFIYSDLVDIEFSESELYETAQYDAMSNTSVCEQHGEQNIPLGKMVV